MPLVEAEGATGNSGADTPTTCTAQDDQVVEHPMTGVIAKRLGSSWIDVLARLLLIATGVTDRTRT
jgi:hypothetical protein